MSKHEKTFVILTPGFASSEYDTTCLPSQQNFIRSLHESYPQLKIVVLAFQYPYHTKTYYWNNIRIMSFDGRNRGGLARMRLRRKVQQRLQEIHAAGEIVGLLSFWYGECAFVGKRFGDKYGVRHLCWIRGQDARKTNKYPRKLPPLATDLVALSDFLCTEFEKSHGVRPFEVITPGIDQRLYPNRKVKRDIDMLAVGSLIPLKRYEVFIELVSAIKASFPSVRAILVGKGPEEERLRRLIAENNLGANIELVGEKSYQEVLSLMQRARIFLHPSSYEGFSGVCLEALAGGASVVSFCKPMNQDFDHWHIAATPKEMLDIVSSILHNSSLQYNPLTISTVEESVKKIMEKFHF